MNASQAINEHWEGSIQTNDAIQLHVPIKQHQKAKSAIQWKVSIPDESNKLWKMLVNKRVEHPKMHGTKSQKIDNSSHIYYCSALDLGCTVTAILTIKCQKYQKSFRRVMQYGPISIQKQLLLYPSPERRREVQVIIGAEDKKKAKIEITKIGKDQQKSFTLKLLVEEESLVITAKDSDGWGSFLKFYPKEEEGNKIFGIMINQQEQFIKFMRKLKISAHYGSFLKIRCFDRQCRDLLLLEMLQVCDAEIPQQVRELLKKSRPQDSFSCFEIETVIRKIGKSQEKNSKSKGTVKAQNKKSPQLLNTFGSNSKIPLMKKSDFDFDIKESNLINEKDHKSRTGESVNIIEQIYHILNTPLSSVQKQAELAHLEFDNHSKQFYNAQTPKLNIIYSQTIEPSKFKQADTLMKESFISQDDENFELNFRKKRNSAIGLTKQDKDNTKKKNNDDIMYVYRQKQNESIINKLVDTSESQNINEEEIPEKWGQKGIEFLVNKNKQLEEENRRLKEQNFVLRYQKDRYGEIDMHKMVQIREMVQKMANRLQVLQIANKNQSPAKKTKRGIQPLFTNNSYHKCKREIPEIEEMEEENEDKKLILSQSKIPLMSSGKGTNRFSTGRKTPYKVGQFCPKPKEKDKLKESSMKNFEKINEWRNQMKKREVESSNQQNTKRFNVISKETAESQSAFNKTFIHKINSPQNFDQRFFTETLQFSKSTGKPPHNAMNLINQRNHSFLHSPLNSRMMPVGSTTLIRPQKSSPNIILNYCNSSAQKQ